jgi:outer membrane lipoprotein-sorting protein
MKEKEKLMIEIIASQMEDTVVLAKAILAEEDAEDVQEAVVDAVEEETIVTISEMWNVAIVAKRVTILLTAHSQEKMTMKSQTWFPRRISKTYSNHH